MTHQYENLTYLLMFLCLNLISFIILIYSFANIHNFKSEIKYKKTYFFNTFSLILCSPIILNYFIYTSSNHYFWKIILIVSFLSICYTIYLNTSFLIKSKKMLSKQKITSIKISIFTLQLLSLSLIINYIYNLYFVFYL